MSKEKPWPDTGEPEAKPEVKMVPDPEMPPTNPSGAGTQPSDDGPAPKTINFAAPGKEISFQECLEESRKVWHREKMEAVDDAKAVKVFLNERKQKKLKSQPTK